MKSWYEMHPRPKSESEVGLNRDQNEPLRHQGYICFWGLKLNLLNFTESKLKSFNSFIIELAVIKHCIQFSSRAE